MSVFDVSELVVKVCGMGRVLVLGDDSEAIAKKLLSRGLDASCSDTTALNACDGESFVTVCAILPSHLLGDDGLAAVLSGLYRVTKKNVLLFIDFDAHGRGCSATQTRSDWERACFEHGFRKHPGYFRANDYNHIGQEGRRIAIPLQKITAELSAATGDISRETGIASNQKIMQYAWACTSTRPGDRVLVLGCGTGYGPFMLEQLSLLGSVTGVDEHPEAIAYAQAHFEHGGEKIRYVCADLLSFAQSCSDHAYDAVLFFGHSPISASFFAEDIRRILAPNGRFLTTLPGSVASREDYSYLCGDLPEAFIFDSLYAQDAHSIRQCQQNEVLTARDPAQVWLLSVMKSPLGVAEDYQERVFANLKGSQKPTIHYDGYYKNPWVVHSVVNLGYRVKDKKSLGDLAGQIMAAFDHSDNEYASALCICAYQSLDGSFEGAQDALLSRIDDYISLAPKDPMALRWRISLLYVRAKIFLTQHKRQQAFDAFLECARSEIRPFGIHLATKVTDAYLWAGKIALSDGNADLALSIWEEGVRYGDVLLSTSLNDILINRDYPNSYNHGDGVKEYALAWDTIAKCADGVFFLKKNGSDLSRPLDEYVCIYESGLRQMAIRDAEIETVRQDLVARTEELVQVRRDLELRTQEMVQSREDLVTRTEELVQTREDLVSRTHDLEQTRAELIAAREQGQLFSQHSADLEARTQELVQTRKDLVSRTEELVQTRADLELRTQELVQTREDLVTRTEDLVQTRADLELRTQELVQARADQRPRWKWRWGR